MNQPISDIPDYTYFTEEGIKVIDTLLSKNNGPRILIDLKHIDYRGRKQYYEHIRKNYGNEIPVVISHAAVGSPDDTMPPWFNPWNININNADIEAVCLTNGIIGILFDQRVLGFNELKQYKKARHISYNKLGKKFSVELIWNSIRYIAEKAAYLKNASPSDVTLAEPWDILAIGTDFDGIINPINQFPTLSEMPKLRKELVKVISEYFSSPICDPILQAQTTSTPEEIVEKIFYGNAMRFLAQNF
jgi:microsomal dipeptidase-like Zn-dependent dipeptidase